MIKYFSQLSPSRTDLDPIRTIPLLTNELLDAYTGHIDIQSRRRMNGYTPENVFDFITRTYTHNSNLPQNWGLTYSRPDTTYAAIVFECYDPKDPFAGKFSLRTLSEPNRVVTDPTSYFQHTTLMIQW